MIVTGQVFESEHFHITVLSAPWCKAVIDDTAANTCTCFTNALKMRDRWKHLTRDNDWKILFTNCGKGEMMLKVRTNEHQKIDFSYYTNNYIHLFALIKKILEQSDQFHIKKGNLWQALHPTEDAHILELQRGVPKHLWEKHFPQYYDAE